MDYIILLDDESHRKALENYYKKYFYNKLEINFSSQKNIDYSLINDKTIIIGDKNEIEILNLNNQKIYISNDNNIIIDIYGSAKLFFEFLDSYVIEKKSYADNKIIGVAGIFGNVGTTLISLSIAKYMSEFSKTLFISLEKVPSGKCYLKQSLSNSFSNLIFYLKQNPEIFIEKVNNLAQYHSEYKFYYFSDVEYLEDLFDLKDEEIIESINLLKESSFNNIVIDYGIKFELLNKTLLDKRFFVMEQELIQYQRLDSIYKFISRNCYETDIDLIINKRKHDLYINESYLRKFKSFNYISYDFKLENKDSKILPEKLIKEIEDLL